MSVESVRTMLNYTTVFADFDVRGLDTSHRDAWVSLVHSGELTYRITEQTPALNRIETLCSQVTMSFYSLTLWAFHADSNALALIQQMLDDNMSLTDDIKALIEASPPEDDAGDYGYGVSKGYVVQVVEEGYMNNSAADENDEDKDSDDDAYLKQQPETDEWSLRVM